jgi:hypothetical protein
MPGNRFIERYLKRHARTIRNGSLIVSGFSVITAIIDVVFYFMAYPTLSTTHIGIFVSGIPFGEVLLFLAIASVLSLVESVFPQPRRNFSTDLEYARLGFIAGIVFSLVRYVLDLFIEVLVGFVTGVVLGVVGGLLSAICYVFYKLRVSRRPTLTS